MKRNIFFHVHTIFKTEGGGGGGEGVAQNVMCLATYGSLTADAEVTTSIPARFNTFMKIHHEIISGAFLIPFADSFKKGCCQLQAKVCAQSTG